MSHEVVVGGDMPRALGPYSPVVRVSNLLFLSAQTGVDQERGQVPQGEFEDECRQAFANIGQALRASGSDLSNVVKTTIFYADLALLPIINKVFAEVFPNQPPTRSAAIVGLAGGRRISVDAIAVISE